MRRTCNITGMVTEEEVHNWRVQNGMDGPQRVSQLRVLGVLRLRYAGVLLGSTATLAELEVFIPLLGS